MYVCVCVNYYFPFLSFFFLLRPLLSCDWQSVDGIRKRMRTGGLYERKHIDNCQYRTDEEMCGNNRHDQLLSPSLLRARCMYVCVSFRASFHSYVFACLSFSLFRT